MRQIETNGEAEPMLGMKAIAHTIQALTGHKPGRSTLWRWHLSGRLASRRIGGRLYSTERAIREMLAADECRNRGSTNARGEAAAARLAKMLDGGRRAHGEVA